MCSGYFGKLQVPVYFNEVAVYFSEEEWQYLEDWQKVLYKEVMQDNLEAVLSLEEQFPLHNKEDIDTDGFGVKLKWTTEERTSQGGGTANTLCKTEVYGVLEKIHHRCSECQEDLGSWSLLIAHKIIHFRARYAKHLNMAMVQEMTPTVQQTNSDQLTVGGEEDPTCYRTCKQQSLYKCIEYERTFTERSKLSAHKKIHMEGKIGKNEKKASSHAEMIKPKTEVGDDTLHCIHCNKMFSQWSLLVEHEKTHKLFYCSDCGKNFVRKSILVLHRRTHTGERPFACTDCGKRFSQRFNLVIHQRIHTGEKPYRCATCEKSFRYKPALLRHEQQAKCVKNMTRKYPILKTKNMHPLPQKHISAHCVTNSPAVQCQSSLPPSLCQRSVPLHSSQLHTIPPIPQPIMPPVNMNNNCIASISRTMHQLKNTTGKSQINPHHLVALNQSTHPDDKPFKCGQCKKAFIQWNHLMEHQKSHTGSRNVCSECNKSFIRRSTLILHRRIHTGEKPYKCMECGKGFSQRFNLVVHHRIHTGERPYKCKDCEKAFRYRAGLLRHQRYALCLTKQKTVNKYIDNQKVSLLPSQKNTSITSLSISPGLLHSSSTPVFIGLSKREQIHHMVQPFECSQSKQKFLDGTQLPPHQETHKEAQNAGVEFRRTFTRRLKHKLRPRYQTDVKPFTREEYGKPFSHQTNFTFHNKFQIGPNTQIKSEDPFFYHPILQSHEVNTKYLRNSKKYNVLTANHAQPPSNTITSLQLINKLSAAPSTSTMLPINNPMPPSPLMIVSPPPHPPIFINNTQIQGVRASDSSWPKETQGHDFVVKPPSISNTNQALILSPVAHSGEKLFKCDQCKRSFTEWTPFMEHQKTHSLARHTCTDCGKNFNKMSQLMLHQRTHTGEKPYVCGKCGKQFSQKFNLVVHQRIHTGEKPFKCPDCNKAFRYRTGLLKHQKYGLCL
ncbi:uncharacterized protein O3C94_005966 [Discoglossus pictus]